MPSVRDFEEASGIPALPFLIQTRGVFVLIRILTLGAKIKLTLSE
jgi:hypothetical protein